MGANSKIEWTDHTFNPWMGCTKVSRGCENCYAERDWDKRYHRVKWGPKGERLLTSDAYWKEPLKWNRQAAAAGVRARVFCASLADVFDDHPSILLTWRVRLNELITTTPSLEWLLLTKRPENWRRFIFLTDHQNVRLGVTIEDQAASDERSPFLLSMALRTLPFISYEPALGPVDWRMLFLRGLPGLRRVGWLIAGGESGPDARPSHPGWFRAARDVCRDFGVPFFFKQHGEWLHETQTTGEILPYPTKNRLHEWTDDTASVQVGKKRAGRLLDGCEHNDFPDAAP